MSLMKIIMFCGLLWQIDYSHIPTHGEGNGLVSNGVLFTWSCRTKMFSMSLWLFSAQLCPILCDPMGCSMPGFPVHHQLPELAQTHCPLSWWCHPTVSSSVAPFSTSPQSFPAQCFLISWFFASGGQSSGVSASASVLPMNIQGWLPTMDSKNLLQHHSLKASLLQLSLLYGSTLTSNVTTGKTIALTIWTLVSKVMSLLLNTLFRFVITVVKLWKMSSLAPSISSKFIFDQRPWNLSVPFTCALWDVSKCFSNLAIYLLHWYGFISMQSQSCVLLDFIYEYHSSVKFCKNRPERNAQGHFYCN